MSSIVPDLSSLLSTAAPAAPAGTPPAAPSSAPAVSPQPGGRLKKILSNFAEGFGDAIAAQHGLPTQKQQQQQQFQNQLLLRKQVVDETNSQSLSQLRDASEADKQSQNELVDVPGAWQTKYGLPAKVTRKNLNTLMPGLVSAEGREITTGQTVQGRTDVAKINTAGKADKPNEIQLIMRANQGDPDASAALKTLQSNRIATSAARGAAMGQYRMANVYDPETGQTTPMFMHDIEQARASGKTLLSAGAMPAGVLLASQRLKSEAMPAIEQTKQYLGAYDNPSDRAIFARVMKDNPMPEGGDVHSWVGNILNQSLVGNLSPQGQQLAIRLKRLNETVGTLRATLGLPATNSATALTLGMLPGASTPNSQFAKDQLDQLGQVVNQALNVPGLGNKTGGSIPDAAAAQLKEGVPTTFKNGQTWTKQNGKTVRLK